MNEQFSKPKNFGYIPPENWDEDQRQINIQALAHMPEFEIRGAYRDAEQALLYECRQQVSGKDDPPYIWQSTGSCVGAGGGNCLLTVQDVEIVLGGESQEPKMVWWLFPYGESREIARMRGRGSGSFGSAYAQAITQRGVFSADADSQLPPFKMRDGWYYLNQSIELDWSDGYAIDAKWNELGKEHLVQTMAPIKSADQAAEALLNGYAMTAASSFGTRPRVQGSPAVLLGEWNDTWHHQMFCDAYWDHPTLGKIFRIGNNWGPRYHGNDPSGAPQGGFWVRHATLHRICLSGEVFAMSSFEGFPARDLDWSKWNIPA